MKRGFAEHHQRPFTLAIELLYQLGRYREALDTAEQARGRAFADLLAGREQAGSNVSEARRSGSAARAELPPPTVSKAGELQMRGTETAASGVPRLRSANDLASLSQWRRSRQPSWVTSPRVSARRSSAIGSRQTRPTCG